ncbi:unnamed protein product [Rotaria socialis]|uniref:Uncharacterized protein n=1 Tax=Rotaria socialis TaxID=392032 RepID=A0A820WNL8_9BILA|nr:unnamed protein product [Rotaria socialis]CAF4554077.1 unnamed protein product [Rotaria socialis]CAF4872282.1 unnamed protein product [Rotaria socialis]
MAIVAALNSCFHVPMVVASPEDDDIVRRMNQLLSKSNILHEWFIQDNLQRHNVWQCIDIDNLFDPFPVLSLDDIRSITLGVYQLKRAKSYAEEHNDCTELTDPDFDLHINHAPIIHTFNLTQHKLSHAAIWFLGYERAQSTTNRQSSSTNTTNIQYADDISDFEPSSDDEDNSYIYTSE